MEIKFIDNNNEKIGDVINTELASAKEVSIAVAFLKMSGIEQIENSLKTALTNKATVKIIVGLDFFTTEAEAISYFLNLNKDNKNIEIYCYHIPKGEAPAKAFHPKLYIFAKEGKYTTIIGSSNLTKGGLFDNVEVNTVITETTPTQYKEAKSIFDNLINSNYCIPATEALIAGYSQTSENIKAKTALLNNAETKKKRSSFYNEFFRDKTIGQSTEQAQNNLEIKDGNEKTNINWLDIILLYLAANNLTDDNGFEIAKVCNNIAFKTKEIRKKDVSTPKQTLYTYISRIYSKSHKKNGGKNLYFENGTLQKPKKAKLTPEGIKALNARLALVKSDPDHIYQQTYSNFKNNKS